MREILPAAWRRRIYVGYAVTGVGIGATQVGFQSAGADQPTALTVVLAVYAYLGIALGFTAASNTPADD